MGIPSVLTLPLRCQKCGNEIVCWIQFNFGARVEATYRIGSPIEWRGPDDFGRAGLKRVGVAGIGSNCPECNEQPAGTSEFNIIVEQDTIVKAEPFHSIREPSGADYTVMEE